MCRLIGYGDQRLGLGVWAATSLSRPTSICRRGSMWANLKLLNHAFHLSKSWSSLRFPLEPGLSIVDRDLAGTRGNGAFSTPPNSSSSPEAQVFAALAVNGQLILKTF